MTQLRLWLTPEESAKMKQKAFWRGFGLGAVTIYLILTGIGWYWFGLE